MADVNCAKCGTFIDGEDGSEPPEGRRPCPNCGSLGRKFGIRLQGGIQLIGSLTARLSSTRELFDIDILPADVMLRGLPPEALITPAVGSAAGSSSAHAEGRAIRDEEKDDADLPNILLNAAIVVTGDSTSEGRLVTGVSTAWFEIVKQLQRDPQFLYKIGWRQMEELIAGAYERSGCPDVVLTPRAGDKGRDVIATWPGVGSIRIIEQVKAYGPNHLVKADDVRSVLGVLSVFPNTSKALITTTSDFAPGVLKDPELLRFMPYRLNLKNGPTLVAWLKDIAAKKRPS